MVEEKSPSWVKHAFRRWKQFCHEIQSVDGQVDTSNPLSAIFRNESLATKQATPSNEVPSRSPEPDSSKKDTAPQSQPEKTPPSKPEQKQSKGRFLFKLRELQCLLNLLNFF